jgi:hypothetical protein
MRIAIPVILILSALLLSGCQPLTPQQRAAWLNVAQGINEGAQQQAIYNQQNAAQMMSIMQQGRPQYQQPNTFYVRPDPLQPGGAIVSPNRWGY